MAKISSLFDRNNKKRSTANKKKESLSDEETNAFNNRVILGEEAARRSKHGKKRNRLNKTVNTLSFNVNDLEEHDQFNSDHTDFLRRKKEKKKKHRKEKKSSKKRKKFGFGGAVPESDGLSEEEIDDSFKMDNSVTRNRLECKVSVSKDVQNLDSKMCEDENIGFYGKGDLAKLKSQQKSVIFEGRNDSKDTLNERKLQNYSGDKTLPANEHFQIPSALKKSCGVPADEVDGNDETTNDCLGDYVSLNNSSKKMNDEMNSSSYPIIFTGDDAMNMMEKSSNVTTAALVENKMKDDNDFTRADSTCLERLNSNRGDQNHLGPSNVNNSSRDVLDSLSEDDPLERIAQQYEKEKNESQWEEKLVARGMDLVPKSKRKSSSTPNTLRKQEKNLSQSTGTEFSVGKIKTAIASAATRLHETIENLESSSSRRQSEFREIKNDTDRKESTISESGNVFEFFQQKRIELVDWVGALRNLHFKLEKVEEAKMSLLEERAMISRRKCIEAEDDEIQNLVHEMKSTNMECSGGRIEVIGRQVVLPFSSDRDNEVSAVDEFGRDVTNLIAVKRARRCEKRRSRFRRERLKRSVNGDSSDERMVQYTDDSFSESKDMGELSDFYVSDDERSDQLLRWDTLDDAFGVARNETSEDYMSLGHLVETFAEWERRFPNEYKQCYAVLSFVDLAAVLVRAEMCTVADFLCVFDHTKGMAKSDKEEGDASHNLSQYSWFRQLERCGTEGKCDLSHKSDNEGNYRSSVTDIIIQKLLLPRFIISIEKHYDPHSKRQCKAASELYLSLVKHIPTKLNKKTINSIFQCLNHSVNDIAIPVLKSYDFDQSTSKDAQIFSLGQLWKLKKIIINICQYWIPALRDSECYNDFRQNFANFVLMDIFASRLLPIVNIIKKSGTEGRAMAREFLYGINEVLKPTGWLDASDLMLCAAPFRLAIGSLK